MQNKILILLTSIIFITGCEKIFLGDEPKNNPEVTFNQFWLDFDRYYANFVIKNIDWDSVHFHYHQKISHSTTNQELFSYFKQIILPLKDAHVDLYSSLGVLSYNYYESSPLNSPEYVNKYITFRNTPYSDIITYGEVRGTNYGYIRLKTFAGFADVLNSYRFIDEIIEEFSHKDGIILDVRSNGGGNLSNAEVIAGRFADRQRLYKKEKYKNGPGKNDFSEWFNYYIKPGGAKQFLKPVIVLTNKIVGSSAESFVLAMKSFPHVISVGDTTAGASGNPVFRELPNGWTMRLSTSYGSTSDGFIFEGQGLNPDVPIWITEEDILVGRDAILEKAIELLGND